MAEFERRRPRTPDMSPNAGLAGELRRAFTEPAQTEVPVDVIGKAKAIFSMTQTRDRVGELDILRTEIGDRAADALDPQVTISKEVK